MLNILIVGLGLMGGSLACALKKFGAESTIAGHDADPSVMRRALETGIVDRLEPEGFPGIAGYDLVFLAVPVGRIVSLARLLMGGMSPGSLLTDVGSVKEVIAREIRETLPEGIEYIGGHPMTGSEVQGLDGADPHLFENAVYVLTVDTDSDALVIARERLAGMLRSIGALVVEMPAAIHDEIVTFVSHLPYVAAVSLVNVLKSRFPTVSEALSLAAGGFHDCTRVAACTPDVFRDILAANSDHVVAGIDQLIQELRMTRDTLVEGRKDDLESRLTRAREVRRTLPARHRAYPLAIFDLVVRAEDRPGFLGDLASLLGHHRINIKDFVLMQVRPQEAGTIRLTFHREKDLQEALGVLEEGGYRVTRR